MNQFYLKINEKINIFFISSVTLMSHLDVAFHKRNAGQVTIFRVWLFSLNDSISLAVKKRFLRLNVIYRQRPSVKRIFRRYIGAKNHNFNIPLILNKYNIMIVVQKIKFMQEFTFSINVECLHSNLRAKAKLLMHNFARVFVAYKEF